MIVVGGFFLRSCWSLNVVAYVYIYNIFMKKPIFIISRFIWKLFWKKTIFLVLVIWTKYLCEVLSSLLVRCCQWLRPLACHILIICSEIAGANWCNTIGKLYDKIILIWNLTGTFLGWPSTKYLGVVFLYVLIENLRCLSPQNIDLG